MKNYVQPGDVIEITSAGAIVAGRGVLLGSLFGVAINGAAGAGEKVSLATEGVFDLPKVGSQSWVVGAQVFWDAAANSGAGAATTTASTHKRIGVAVADVAGGAGDTIGRIKLIGVPVN
jgi:predicted RecA/RadA family phage recombinase